MYPLTGSSLVGGLARGRKVSRHLHPFYVKCGICQLTDHAYSVSMSIFCTYSVTVILNKLLRCIVRHGISVCTVWTAIGLLYKLRIMVKCVLYGALDPLVS
jgi:hypothetical protein